MKERPILFSAPMVRAILDGKKMQTRRLAKWKLREPGLNLAFSGLEAGLYHSGRHDAGWVLRSRDGGGLWNDRTHQLRCPYGVPGDRLWVREAWQALHVSIDPETGHGDDVQAAPSIPKDSRNGWWSAVHAATDPQASEHRDDRGFAWRPGIHMPRWASRITLEVTEVRVERLQAITEEEARAEGVTPFPRDPEGDCWTDGTHRTAFEYLWGQINGFESWLANPWVWVVSFRRLEQIARAA